MLCSASKVHTAQAMKSASMPLPAPRIVARRRIRALFPLKRISSGLSTCDSNAFGSIQARKAAAPLIAHQPGPSRTRDESPPLRRRNRTGYRRRSLGAASPQSRRSPPTSPTQYLRGKGRVPAQNWALRKPPIEANSPSRRPHHANASRPSSPPRLVPQGRWPEGDERQLAAPPQKRSDQCLRPAAPTPRPHRRSRSLLANDRRNQRGRWTLPRQYLVPTGREGHDL